jgi:hypothetical protein
MFCFLLIGRKKERKTETPGSFFPRAGYALLAVPCRIFTAVRWN